MVLTSRIGLIKNVIRRDFSVLLSLIRETRTNRPRTTIDQFHQNTTKTMNYSMNIDYKMHSIMFKVNSLPSFVFVYLDWKFKNELRLKNNTHSGMNKDILHNSFHDMDSHLYKIPNLWSRIINRSDLFKGFKTLGPYSMGHAPWEITNFSHIASKFWWPSLAWSKKHKILIFCVKNLSQKIQPNLTDQRLTKFWSFRL